MRSVKRSHSSRYAVTLSRHPVVLDLLLAVDSEAALDLELDGQAVRVPAGLARHAVAAHRLVARKEVLEDARDDVVRAGQPVGRGRTLVEHVHRGVVAPHEALLEDAVLFPEREDARIERREVDARGHLAEPGSLVAHVTRFRRAAGRKADGPAGRKARRPILPDTAGALRRGPFAASPPHRCLPFRASGGHEHPARAPQRGRPAWEYSRV
jgi:hypothetical protein